MLPLAWLSRAVSWGDFREQSVEPCRTYMTSSTRVFFLYGATTVPRSAEPCRTSSLLDESDPVLGPVLDLLPEAVMNEETHGVLAYGLHQLLLSPEHLHTEKQQEQEQEQQQKIRTRTKLRTRTRTSPQTRTRGTTPTATTTTAEGGRRENNKTTRTKS